MKHYKNIAMILIIALISVSSVFSQKHEKTIVIGVAPGPYGDLITRGIKPYLEKKGYTIELKQFSDYIQPDLALNNKEVDANLYQHTPFLVKLSADRGLKLSPVIKIPTAGVGVYSKKIKNISQLKDGDEVTIPNDPTNETRALKLLSVNNLITFKQNIDVTKASEKDIESNPHNLKIRPVEAAQLPRTLDAVAISVINGNYAIAAGIPLNSALIKEVLDEDHKNVLAVHSDDVNKQFVKDLKEAIESETFKKAIENPKDIFNSFQKPQWYLDKWKIKQ
ncbi:MAG: MetQ/NlpA family ABC transporter substrate-binding protein [Ignavibacteriaceae bacterium]|jgi:D-methionine transport system substrate-binding protein